MINAIISIKPDYVARIIGGNKKYEFRKRVFKQDVSKVYIYATKPIQRIVGFFEYKGYVSGEAEYVWERTKEYSGIDYDTYINYFGNSDQAYAIPIDNLFIFNNPIDPKLKIDNFTPPQSYMYIKDDII